jgi:hypothetical protein
MLRRWTRAKVDAPRAVDPFDWVSGARDLVRWRVALRLVGELSRRMEGVGMKISITYCSV